LTRRFWFGLERTWQSGESTLTTGSPLTKAPGFREIAGSDLSDVELFVDFDGTLAPIVDDPDDAAANPGVIVALDRLCDELRAVTVVSGRPVRFLRGVLEGSRVELVGLYGIEALVDDVVVVDPRATPWEDVIGRAAAAARVAGVVGMEVEHKQLSLTLHYRGRPDIAASVECWALARAEESGLEARPARQAMELHPPVAIDKGAVILDRVETETRMVVYIGDDVGDLAAFSALDGLELRGLSVVRVAVASDEAPIELLDSADIVLGDTAAVLSFLNS